MEIDVIVPEDMSENLEKASKELGLEENEVVVRAIKFYLNSIKDRVALKEELEAWETAAIEDAAEFEKRI